MFLRSMIGRVVRPKLNTQFDNLSNVAIVEDDDTIDDHLDESTEISSLSGLALIVEYQDSRGQRSQRLITCKKYEVRAGTPYITAFCHHRNAVRQFRLDRIGDIFDPSSGESLSPVQAFFAQFQPDMVTKSGLTWGLSVGRKADLIALLNGLVFIARCDKEFHHAEQRTLETAVTAFWLRLDVLSDPPIDDILHYAERLAPDGETFWLAMQRFNEDKRLAKVFRTQAQQLIQADGVIRPEETYWAIEIDEFFGEL